MKKLFKKLAIAITLIGLLSCVGCTSSGDNSSGSENNGTTEYTIRFVQDGQEDVVKKVNAGQSLTDIPNPQSVTGYTVVWENVDFQNITEDLTVNAIATANSYTVTYDVNGGLLNITTESFVYDADYVLPTPTKENCEFVGWKNGTETVELTGEWKIATNVTLVAQWEEKETYTITYNLGTNTQAGLLFSTQTVVYGEDFTLVIPSNENNALYFVHWVITGTNTVFEDGVYMLKENVSLTAVWDTVFSGQH